MKWLLVLLIKPNYVISIEKEGIVIGCPGIFNFKPSKSGQVYCIGVNFTLEQATKAQRGSRGIVLLSL
jgi:N-acetylglutamate synthase-like GNAT family acetyltransferase